MAYVIEAKLPKDVVEANLRARLTKIQNEVGMEDHGWVLGSEAAEVKAKIVRDRIGDWRAKHNEAYALCRDIFVWERS